MNPPQTQEYPQSFSVYIDLVKGDVISTLNKQAEEFSNFINSIADLGDYAYADGKWTLKELVGHMIDTERIMVFRLLSIARGEQANLPGFDEDNYVRNAYSADRKMESLAEEFSLLRKANMLLIANLSEIELDRVGHSNGNKVSVRALIYMLAGHVIHHENVIKERYLSAK